MYIYIYIYIYIGNERTTVLTFLFLKNLNLRLGSAFKEIEVKQCCCVLGRSLQLYVLHTDLFCRKHNMLSTWQPNAIFTLRDKRDSARHLA